MADATLDLEGWLTVVQETIIPMATAAGCGVDQFLWQMTQQVTAALV